MSDLVPFPPPPPENHEALYLVGFRLDPAAEEPQMYSVLALYGENDRPATEGGRVLVFADPGLAGAAVERADNGVKDVGDVPTEMALICDVAGALHIINSQDVDEDGAVLDVISCFDDLIRAVQINVPAQYMSVLSALTERLNEQDEFGTWLAEQGVDRETVEDAIMWCVGAVAVKSKVVNS